MAHGASSIATAWRRRIQAGRLIGSKNSSERFYGSITRRERGGAAFGDEREGEFTSRELHALAVRPVH